jgi:hypothetical protein
MTETRPIPFREFRAFLERLGYVHRSTPSAHVFEHPTEGRLHFRVYRADEPVESHDRVFVRKFLDFRGVIEAEDFDAAFVRADTPA